MENNNTIIITIIISVAGCVENLNQTWAGKRVLQSFMRRLPLNLFSVAKPFLV